MPQHSIFQPANEGHRLRLELVDHTMSHAGDFRQMGVSMAPLDGDYRSLGYLRYPERFGSELIDGDIRCVVDRWLWSDPTNLIRYLARQQRVINQYCNERLIRP